MEREIFTNYDFKGVSRILNLPNAINDSDPVTFFQLKAVQESVASPFIYTQNSPSATWVINHNLGYYPSVEIMDSGSQEIDGDISHPTVNQTVISLNPPTSGIARLI